MAAARAKTNSSDAISVKALEKREINVAIKGTAALIVHRWSDKAREQMLDKQMGATRQKKAPKDPVADYEASMYRLPDGSYGFPATAFKSATIGAARNFEDVTMTRLRTAIFVFGEGPEALVKIEGAPEPREDMVRISMGTADIRHRAMFPDWTATLKIRFLPAVLTEETVLALIDAGGMGGVGEWRPSKADTGLFGTYEITGVSS
jgi:hypothetical protein